ncbi:MAG: FHA domain-containing protein [Deltaproteobacteria bacterium]|nr:MAG: FHA domain-containing protein [Deltaproteobacteria bacterium]
MHDLRSSVTTIGSADRGIDIRLPTAHISANHWRIELRARGAGLVDVGSKNGTYYENKRTLASA